MEEKPKRSDFRPLPDFKKKDSSAGEEATCCGSENKGASVESSCCGVEEGKIDWLLWGSLLVSMISLIAHWVWRPMLGSVPLLGMYFHHLTELLMTMSWGILAGIVAVGLMSWIPRSWVARVLGTGGGVRGLLRATAAGLLLDLCNHGVLMVGAQLYRKGATLGQTVAFLVASPWNSFSMTLILLALIGWKWTLLFIALSMLVALVSGFILDRLVSRGVLPENPVKLTSQDLQAPGWSEVKQSFDEFRKHEEKWIWALIRNAVLESRMILRWIFFGAVLAAAVQAFVPTAVLGTWFGATGLGLLLTLLVTTVMEVCSEGSSPIAADLLNRAAAPGNAFTFLMAGAATDYTEIMILKEVTRSWKCSLFVPLVAVPQVMLIGYLLNLG